MQRPTEHHGAVVRFGVFAVDLEARELRKRGARIRLQEQPFQILTALLERPSAVVTRRALRERLWPAGTFVDFEHGLNAAVKRLRTALGDAADNPRFVETPAMRRPQEARALAAQACDIDPLCLVVTTSEAWVHYVARDYQSALQAARHVLDMDPDFPQAHQLCGAAALALGRGSDALCHLERAVEFQHRHPVPLAWLAHGLASLGDIEAGYGLLRELTAIARHRYVSPYGMALVHTALGRDHEALDALHSASIDRACEFVNLAVEPRFDPLRHTLAFGQLLHRLGLSDLERAV